MDLNKGIVISTNSTSKAVSRRGRSNNKHNFQGDYNPDYDGSKHLWNVCKLLPNNIPKDNHLHTLTKLKSNFSWQKITKIIVVKLKQKGIIIYGGNETNVEKIPEEMYVVHKWILSNKAEYYC